MTVDTALVLKALAEETSGTDGTGAALDLGGDPGLFTALINVTVVDGDPPSKLDLSFEVSADNANWFVAAKAPTIQAPGSYRVLIGGGGAIDKAAYTGGLTAALVFAARSNPRYIRKVSVVTAGDGGDGVTFSVHLTA